MAVLVGLMAVIALGMGIYNIVTKHSSGKTVAGVVLGSITFVFFLLSIIIFAAA